MTARRIVFAVPRPKVEGLPAGLLDRIVAAMRPHKVRVLVLDRPADTGAHLAREAASADVVAIGGGDGTLNGAIDTLIELDVPLLVIPLGTANDLARTLQIPADPVQAAGLAQGTAIGRVDIGRVNGQPFFNVASVGLGVDVAQRLAGGRKRWGPLSYLFAAADVWRVSRSFRIWIVCDGEEVTMRSIQVSVGNGRFHGGGIAVADDAEITDGRLDVYSLEPQPWWRLMAMLPAMPFGQHRYWRTVTALRGREVELRTRRPRLVNVDGEVLARTPARFEVVRAAVAVLVPADSPVAIGAAGPPADTNAAMPDQASR